WFWIKPQGWRDTLVKFPDPQLFVHLIHPLSYALHIDRFIWITNISQGHMRVDTQVFGFMRFWPSDHPSNRALPYEVHDPRAWTTFQIDRGNIAIDGSLGTVHELRLDLFKARDFHCVLRLIRE